MKQAVILAGGKGTRLRERLNGLPKPMINICGIPLIERQIKLLKKYNFTNVLLLVSYQSKKIIQFCNNNNNWGIEITCIEDEIPLGTAGSTLNVLNMLADEFLVVYGDTMLEVDLDKFYIFHKKDLKTSVSLFLHPNDHPHDSDLVELDSDENVLNFHPYPHNQNKFYSNLVNAALYWINKDSLLSWKNKVSYLDFGKNIFPEMLKTGYLIRGYRSTEYIKDCGTPARLDKVCNDFINGKIERSKLTHKSKAIFIDRDGTINKEVNHLSNIDDFELICQSASAIKKFNFDEFITCVVTNQPVIARGECTIETIYKIHNKLETLIGKDGAYVDRIYFCPHHPDSGYINEIKELKIDCNCRKPKLGMIKQAVSDLNIDLKESWLIGDSTSDILTAYNAGIKSILVETGYAGLDNKYLISPDFICPDLFSASTFITSHYKIIYDYISETLGKVDKGSVIKIGGLSRVGKSTFAGILKYYLNDLGFKTHLISLDRWIRSENDRKETVLGRYDIESIKNMFNKIENSNKNEIKLNLPYYIKKKKESIDSVDIINVSPNDILIFEGTIVFEIETKQPSKDFFITIDEGIRKKRVLMEYSHRGLDKSEALNIYSSRLEDEVPVIMRKTFANTKEINLENILK